MIASMLPRLIGCLGGRRYGTDSLLLKCLFDSSSITSRKCSKSDASTHQYLRHGKLQVASHPMGWLVSSVVIIMLCVTGSLIGLPKPWSKTWAGTQNWLPNLLQSVNRTSCTTTHTKVIKLRVLVQSRSKQDSGGGGGI